MLCVRHTIDVLAPPTEVRTFDEEERDGRSDDHTGKKGKSYNFKR